MEGKYFDFAEDIDFASTSKEISFEDRVEIAKALTALGYHKTVWHKVEDKDLPKESGSYCCYCKLHFFDRYNNEISDTVYSVEYFDLQLQSFDTINKSVMAWTELTEYKEK